MIKKLRRMAPGRSSGSHHDRSRGPGPGPAGGALCVSHSKRELGVLITRERQLLYLQCTVGVTVFQNCVKTLYRMAPSYALPPPPPRVHVLLTVVTATAESLALLVPTYTYILNKQRSLTMITGDMLAKPTSCCRCGRGTRRRPPRGCQTADPWHPDSSARSVRNDIGMRIISG